MTAPAKAHKQYTLILPVSRARGQVLLGLKKRGFGVGKHNGFGGKVEPGETLPAAAARELREESGLACAPAHLRHHAVLLLETAAAETRLEIHVYVCTEWAGDVAECVPRPAPRARAC